MQNARIGAGPFTNLEARQERALDRNLRRTLLMATALGALTGCGGVIKFSDSSAFNVRGPAPVVAEAPKRVEVKADHLEITEKIQFELDRADIKSESHGLLDEIVQVLREHPQIKKVDVNGHTDSDGADNYNQDLSDRRAKSVVAYLTGHGIDAARLTSKGFGESKPIADNGTSAGKEQNRRVEFLITEQDSEKGCSVRKETSFIVAAGLALLSGCSFFARGPDAYRQVVRDTLSTRSGQIESCYRSELAKDANAGGRVVVKFDVEPKTGTIAEPAIVDGETTAGAGVRNCVLTSLDGLAIAPPDQRKGEATFAWDFQR